MDPVGLPIQSSLAGVGQAERQTIEKRSAQEREVHRFRRILDEAEFGDGLNPTEQAQAVHDKKGSEQEQSDGQRQRRDGSDVDDQPAPRLDLEG